MRLIDADAFINKIREQNCKECVRRKGIKNGKMRYLYEVGGVPCRACETEDVLNEVDDAPTITPEPHWIPVTERLPEEETDVLVTVHFLGLKRTHRNGWNEHIKESYYVEVASHINGEWSSASDEYKIAKDRHKVIAWMPLPEPYKGVTE